MPMPRGAKHTEAAKEKMSLSHKKNPTKYWLGKKFPAATREKISVRLRGRIFTQKTLLKISLALKGRKFTEEHKKNISISRMGIPGWNKGKSCPQFSGKHHPNWKGGKSFEDYSVSFNNQLKCQIRVRDNFVCQLCGIPELECFVNLDIHHIDYDKKNSSIDNLISLCHSCHSKTHYNREHWVGFFKERSNKCV